MAVDNPSYFSIPGRDNKNSAAKTSRFSLLRRHMTKMGSTPSSSSRHSPESPKPNNVHEERYSTPPSTLKRRDRTLLAQPVDQPTQTQMLVLGMPRACDIAPETRSSVSTSDLALNGRYYNVTSQSTNRRRHSIGAYFMQRSGGPMKTSSSQDDLHFRVDAERFPHEKSINSNSNTRCAMEDIIIISSQKSEAAELWVVYLKACFEQIRKNKNKPPYRILNIGVEDLPDAVSPVFENKLRTARLEVLIVCPILLDYVVQFPQRTRRLASLLREGCVLAMLLGVDETMLTEQHRSALVSFPQWRKMESVKDRDEKFVGDFLSEAVAILAKNSGPPALSPPKKCPFMLVPKKVNRSQRKVIVVLQEPLDKDDTLEVVLIRNNEEFVLNNIKKRNPFTFAFRMPDSHLTCTALVDVRVMKNQQSIGSKQIKCESQLTALEQILKHCDDPLDFVCQSLNILPTDKEILDDFFLKAFQRNMPPNFNLLHGCGLGQQQRLSSCKEEYPTLLHFAAEFGLEQLCWALIEAPGGDLACELRNARDLNPMELAEKSGHLPLSTQLASYMQMAQFTSAYSFLKGMVDNDTIEDGNNNRNQTVEYLNPRPISETYQIPPFPRPIEELTPPIGYMPMKPAKFTLDWLNVRSHSTDGSTTSSTRKSQKIDVEDELIEIITDFKNNVFSIGEVEDLVKQWRNRNDVKQSFRDKQKQLSELRQEYERVQMKMKEEMKSVGRPSPLDRVRNFFRSKSKIEKTKNKELRKRMKKQEEPRPASSLSIVSSSSSSSGRLSTESTGSIGDSSVFTNEFDTERGHIENYDILPSPKAVENHSRYRSGNYDVPPSTMHIKIPPVPIPPSNLYYCNVSANCDGFPTTRLNTVEETVETKTDVPDMNYVNLSDFREASAVETNSIVGQNLPEYVNVETNTTVELTC